MKRYLRIEKFRNIGIDKEETLVLNTSLEKNRMGNLIILVGENGSGKSNVLAAIKKIGDKLADRDVTNFAFEEENRKPVLSLVTEYGDTKFEIKTIYGCSEYQVSDNDEDYMPISIDMAIDVCQKIVSHRSELQSKLDALKDQNNSKENVKEIISSLRKFLNECFANRSYHPYNYIWNSVQNAYPDILDKIRATPLDIYKHEYQEKIGISAIPRVIEYSDSQINDKDLSCPPDSINKFIATVLEDIGYKREGIHNAYKMFNQQGNRGILEKLQKDLNKKLSGISQKFNSIYFSSEEAYKFGFVADPNGLSFTISKNETPLTLSYQSVGFRWFFDLYFNMLAKNELNPGDILIMDEPANCLHPRGMQELRGFLKDYAVKANITIVVATNLPFLIDMDNLDELRLIKNAEGKSSIENDFSTICPQNPDALADVCHALTVKHHVICDPDKQLIFVEGITDYNYLTCFKKILGETYSNLSFVPIGGVGDKKDPEFEKHQKYLLKEMKRVGRKRDAFLLVDGDKAGEGIKKINGDNKDLIIVSLKDVNPEFKEIELLFSEEDRRKHGIQSKNGKPMKSSALSSNLKKYSQEKDFSKETKANFKALFDKLIEENS